ncbi:G-protein coupled receptor dmsr-1-like isoform X2 [Diorhabda carinulata]|uniref:G-protein coupled receptor dmsr-1-like isoform X2 n=1 Tax=Diorhabda carinulata TaxID=1163345 RepID=UPI0025A058A6|nr:G-protein coupled receptor dmsr-1-like isoform X2 [Diorhabda carinulata]
MRSCETEMPVPPHNLSAVRIILLKYFPASIILNFSNEDLLSIINQRRNRSLMTDQTTDTLELDCGGDTLLNLSTAYAEKYHVYTSILVCIFGSVANILNIIVLTRKEMSNAPINRILSALAVADMLLMIEYIPFAYYYHDERGRKDFCYYGAVFTLFHINYSQLLHTISVCLTLSLAIWRFLAIGYPKQNHQLCSNSRCTLAICICYILPVFLCIPAYYIFEISSIVIEENNENITLYHTDLKEEVKQDKTLLKINFWLFAVFIKLLPCFILTIISIWLIKTLFDAKKRRQVLRGYDSFPLTVDGKEVKRKGNKAERRSDRTTKMLVAVLLLFLITEFPQGIFAFFIGIKGHDLFLQCYQPYGEVMDIMALANGSINFILYCCMNRMFRTTFSQLFKPRILDKWTGNSSEAHTTTVPNGTNTTTL